MKKISTLLSSLLALCLILGLAACGGEAPAASAPASEASGAVSSAVPENAIAAGTYAFKYVDPYGDETVFTVTTKDTGKVYVKIEGALGSKTFSADAWTDNGDGTFTTDALSEALEMDWVGADGKITWTVDGENVTPVGYTEPTEFLAKSFTDPTSEAEAVGVYTFGFVNGYGATVPYVMWLNADGTAKIFMVSAWVGTQTYTADSWVMNDDNTVTVSGMSYEGEPPKTDGNGATWFADETYESTWTLCGDGSCAPAGFDGKTGEVDFNALGDCYPAGAEKVGVYTFGFVNGYGATVPYVLRINANGTADIFMLSDWVGTQKYSGAQWVLNDDGTVTVSDMSYEGEPPKTDGNGATWFADNSYESTWALDKLERSCQPAGYEGKIGELDLATLAADAYPNFGAAEAAAESSPDAVSSATKKG